MGTRIAVFNQGRIEQLGAPLSLYNAPANEFVATFLGAPRINLVDLPGPAATPVHRALWQLLLPDAGALVRRAGVRAEHLRAGAFGTGVPATVVLAEHLGDASVLHLRVDGVAELLHAKVDARHVHLAAGASVGLLPVAESVMAFDAGGKRLDR
jgi:multiple sugar transport system ATP-binding protein